MGPCQVYAGGAGAGVPLAALATLLFLATEAHAQDVEWSKVRSMNWEPPVLLQHAIDVEMEGLDDTESLSRVGETRANTRIVTGEEAEPHQFPFQVGMLIKDQDGGMFFCGGSLLTPTWVLTAAHCAEPGYIFEVILGAHRIREKEPYQQRFKVNKSDGVVVHPEWDAERTINDIALIPLPKPATLNEYVQLTRIPSPERASASLWNKNATMSGWGKPSDSAESISPVLRFVVTRIVSNYYCTFRYMFVIIKDSNICASGFSGKSTCNGDSGGPLTIPDDDGKSTQVGVTSFGIGLGCEKTWPPAFTRVTSYLPWIANVTGGGYLDTTELGPVQQGLLSGDACRSSKGAMPQASRQKGPQPSELIQKAWSRGHTVCCPLPTERRATLVEASLNL